MNITSPHLKKKVKEALKKAQELEEKDIPTITNLRTEESEFYHASLILKKLTTKKGSTKKSRKKVTTKKKRRV